MENKKKNVVGSVILLVAVGFLFWGQQEMKRRLF